MRFHLDENVTAAVGRGVRERGIDVTFTAQAALLSATDSVQFDYAAREGRVLVSHDADMLRISADAMAAGTSFAGLVYCEKRKHSTGRLIALLLSLASTVPDEEMRGRVEYL